MPPIWPNMACQGRSRAAVRSTLYKACEVKYPTSREERAVGVRCTRTRSAVFTGFVVGVHELWERRCSIMSAYYVNLPRTDAAKELENTEDLHD